MSVIKNKSYIIGVSLGTGCYRHIKISAAATLAELHTAILDAFQFDDDHAHAFFMNNHIWDDTDAYFADFLEEEERYTSEYRLSEVIAGEGHKFVYVFDFGEEWRFNCRVLHITDDFTPIAQVVREKGEAPLQYGEFDEENDDEFVDDIREKLSNVIGREASHEETEKFLEDLANDDGIDDGFPEIYSREKLRKAYSALSLPDKTQRQLKKYFKAFANLYGIIPLKKALSIYNEQNEPISEKDFLAFCEVARHNDDWYVIFGDDDIYSDGKKTKPIDREIVEYFMLTHGEYEDLKAAQQGKSYYIPKKTELLKYSSFSYFEKNIQYLLLQTFLIDRMEREKAENLAIELQTMVVDGLSRTQDYLDTAQERGLEFQKDADAFKFIELLNELNNNTRMTYNRGFTPNEISKKYTPQNTFNNMNSEQIPFFGMSGKSPEPTEMPISKNAPCPCGSGKKYKRCCGKDKE